MFNNNIHLFYLVFDIFFFPPIFYRFLYRYNVWSVTFASPVQNKMLIPYETNLYNYKISTLDNIYTSSSFNVNINNVTIIIF